MAELVGGWELLVDDVRLWRSEILVVMRMMAVTMVDGAVDNRKIVLVMRRVALFTMAGAVEPNGGIVQEGHHRVHNPANDVSNRRRNVLENVLGWPGNSISLGYDGRQRLGHRDLDDATHHDWNSVHVRCCLRGH